MDVRPRRGLVVRALRRFWFLAVWVAVVCGLAATYSVRDSEPTYTAEARYIVPVAPPVADPLPGALPVVPSTLPENAYGAGIVARTYEIVLKDDDALLAAISASSGIPVTDLAESVAVVNLPGTPVLSVSYGAETEREVRAYFDSLSAILTTSSPTPNLPTGNLVPLRSPLTIEEVPGLAGIAPLIGTVAGLLLGLAAAVMLERVDARIWSAGDLRWLSRWPVFDLTGANRAAVVESVVIRALGSGTGPTATRIAVVAVPGTPLWAVSDAADELSQAELRMRLAGDVSIQSSPAVWEAFGCLAGDGVAERGVQVAESAVVITPHWARVSATAAALERLQDLGASNVLLVASEHFRSRRSRSGAPSEGSESVSSELDFLDESPAESTPARAQANRPAPSSRA